MNHKQYQEWLQLSFYDELNEQERNLLLDHLDSCNHCQVEREELKKLHEKLAHRQLKVAQDPLLQNSRRDLRLQILADSQKQTLWARIQDALDDVLSPPLQVAFGGVTAVVIGVFIGYMAFKVPTEKSLITQSISSQSPSMEAGESQIMNIRFIDRDSRSGDVEFTFETITPVHIRGNINEENVQRVLARALVSDQNTGNRIRAVGMIATQTDQGQLNKTQLNPEVRTALITALLHDQNLGVRKEALGVLKNYLPDPVIVRALLDVLANEKSTALKIAAINSLDFSRNEKQPMNPEILEMLKQKAQSDDNNYIRIKAKAALREIQQ